MEEKESEDTGLENDSDETITETEKVSEQTCLDIRFPNLLERKSQKKVISQHIVLSQENIVLSSHSEKDMSEPNKGDNSLWKFRTPKRCSKCVPEETQTTTDKENEGWLKK